jgi:serine/threonine-protein kinase
VWVPAGEFDMGSNEGTGNEKPVRRVRLPGFWLYKTSVTNAMCRKFVADTGHRKPEFEPYTQGGRKVWTNPRFNGDEQPVVGVSWDDAVAYLRWAGARLPTEAEREYAARGPENRRYPWGEQAPTGERAIFERDYGTQGPAAVGSVPAGRSCCGPLDLAGNVWEWCSDWFGPYAAGPQEN